MEFLITESQLRALLTEEEKSMLGSYMKQLNTFTKQIVNRAFKSYGINLRMLLTWGTAVGGMVIPLDQFLRNQNFDLTEDQRMLVLAGLAFSLFFETKRPSMKLFSVIKEEGLEEIFKVGLRKGSQLKEAFLNFMSSVGTGSSSFIDTIAYSFMIPIITDIQSVIMETQDIDEAAILIAERLIASGVVLMSSQALTETVKRVLEKLK
jgi:hypothetical protein